MGKEGWGRRRGRRCSKGENTEGTLIVVWETEQGIKQQRPVREAVYRRGFQMWVKKRMINSCGKIRMCKKKKGKTER